MKITIALCTRNRAASLARVLESLTAMTAPTCPWEVAVIDNDSSDDTPAVMRRFSDRLPLAAYVERKAGISHARNRAVAVATGDYVVWTDDDVVVDPGWLAAYERAFLRWPEASLFGGKIIPVLEQPCVAWFRDNLPKLAQLVAARDFGDRAMALSPDRVPFGANFAVRLAETRRFPYNPDLGTALGRRRGAEETEVLAAMMAAGCIGYWVPDSRVHHMIGLERQTVKYIHEYYMSVGETNVVLGYFKAKTFAFGVPRWLLRRVFVRGLSYRLGRILFPPDVWIKRLIVFSYDKGAVRFFLKTAKRRAAERSFGGERWRADR